MKLFNQKPKITLVGAGPGDPDLLTLKGLKAIQSADIILYDSLANPVLLNHNPLAKKIYVGKRKGRHSFTQKKINSLLLHYAQFNYHVVRLKGGDPMIFGRAMEEIQVARANGIEIDVVPGISSYSGMAAEQQLPITQRGVSRSFWVVSGTDKNGLVSQDMTLAAQSNATIIVFMGMSQLNRLVNIFKQYKRDNYPISIIQNATRPDVKVLFGRLDNILTLQDSAQLASPALIVFGSAAAHLQCIEKEIAPLQAHMI